MILKKVQVRIEPVKNTSEKINHDFRIKKVEYLRTNMYHNKFENHSSSLSINVPDIKILANSYFHKQKKIKQKKIRRNYKRTDLSSGLIGIITLSPHINDMLRNDELAVNSLNKLFEDALVSVIKKIRELCQGEIIHKLYYVIHYDEKTPHLHFMMRNYLSDGRSLFGVVRNSKRMPELQDAVAIPFNSIGFERGTRKSKEKHLTVREMHEVEIKQLSKQKIFLKNEIVSLTRKVKFKRETLININWMDEYEYYHSNLELIMKKLGFDNIDLIPDMEIISEKLDELLKMSEENHLLRSANRKLTSELVITNKIINDNKLLINKNMFNNDDQYNPSPFTP